ncbi:hypothetical protein ACFFQW_36170 [Umezawaea endophytica]|uniref:Lipoprotein n=1 Tax=Umezawaea endophytica TaxID=1654476 RepID=A0A9X3AEZ0_9PSEU|nr:hypothetical protein [Umezawaea endophytica]MCS7477541.1 hypothetical protein [Umezawaea endophytica]
MIRRAAVALLLVPVLAGCGITQTEPFYYGDPPAMTEVDGVRVTFRLEGKKFHVLRAGSPDRSPAERLDLLFAGPTAAERAAGVFTALPDGYRIATPPTEVRDNRIVVEVAHEGGVDLDRFSDVAGEQIACSATPPRVARDVTAVVRAPDGSERGPFYC